MTTPPSAPLTPSTISTLLPILRGISAVAGIFTLVVLALLAINVIQTSRMDVINLPALNQFRTDYRAAPRDAAIQNQIRDLDLLARRAFFSSQDFVASGAILALVGTLIFLAASRTAIWLQWRIPHPTTPEAARTGQTILFARRGIAVVGVLLAFAAGGLWLASRHTGPGAPASPPAVPTTPDAAVPTPAKRSTRLPETPPPPNTWPSFRGPGGNGVAAVTQAPTTWDGRSGSNILWKTAIPLPGFGSPVVISNRVFVAGGNKEKREVFCLDADSGRIIWQKPVTGLDGSPAETAEIEKDYGYASSSMATDGQRVFAIFATGDCAAFDLEGNLVWGRNLGVPENHYAYASSPLVFRHLLIVQYDNKNDPRLMALDAALGNEVWSEPRNGIAWSSPICVNTGSRMELILVCNPTVDSHDPETGTINWSVKCLEGEVAPSAAYAAGMVFVANDTAVAAGIKLAADSNAQPAVAWTVDEKLPDVASPLADGTRLYLATSGGTLTCRAAATGRLLWEQEFTDGFQASPIQVGSSIYALDREGNMHIFKASDTWEPIGSPAIGEPASATPAFANDRIFIRGDKHLFCIAQGKP